jgi:hypothetical protein
LQTFLPARHAQTSSPGFLFPAAGGFQIVEWGRTPIWEIRGRLLILKERFSAPLGEKLFQNKA